MWNDSETSERVKMARLLKNHLASTVLLFREISGACLSKYQNHVMTPVPIKKRINAELFVYRTAVIFTGKHGSAMKLQ